MFVWHLSPYTRAYDSTVINRSLPRNMETFHAKHFQRLATTRIDGINVYKLHNVGVLYDGSILKGLRLFRCLSLKNDEGIVSDHNLKGLLALQIFGKHASLPPSCNYLVIHNPFSNTYYHWLTEALPRLFLIKDFLAREKATLLLPDNHVLSFHQESLNLFAVSNIQYVKPKVINTVRTLITADLPGRIANYNPDLIRAMVNYIKNAIKLDFNLGGKIYISRRKTGTRKVLNENEIETILRKFNYNIICIEDYSFSQQVSIMHHCKFLVAPHGAGMANMIFMNAGGSCFEIRNEDNGLNYFYYTLAELSSLHYYYQICNVNDSLNDFQKSDLTIDPVLLEINLMLLENNSNQ